MDNASINSESQKKLLLIAEVGSVHDGSFGNAKKLIEVAAACGAGAVKFQTHIAEAETLRDAPNPVFFKAEDRYEYFNRTSFSKCQWKTLALLAREKNLKFVSSPFSIEALTLLLDVGVDIIKVPSGEVTNVPLLEAVAASGVPAVLSSGMSNWSELDMAVKLFEKSDLTILQCTSEYPTPPEKVGLNILTAIKKRYGRDFGLSDHTMGKAASICAVGFGATVIERHLTFSRLMYGSDASHSLTPVEFRELAKELDELVLMLNNPVDKDDVASFSNMKKTFQKSLASRTFIKAGEVLTEGNLCTKKPGDGICASEYWNYIGKRVSKDISADRLIFESDFK